MTHPNEDPFAGSDTAPSVSFKDRPVGTTYVGTVVDSPKLVQSRDFQTGEPACWSDGNPKMSVVTRLNISDDEFNLWAPKPSAMFAALADAQKAAQSRIEPGGTLQVTFTGEKPNENTRMNAQKLYAVVYTPGNVFDTSPEQQAPAAPQPVAGPAAAPAPPAPAQAAAPAAPPADPVAAMGQIQAFVRAGMTDEQIAVVLSGLGMQLGAEAVAAVRGSMGAAV